MWLVDQIINQDPIAQILKGGPGSGNWGHAGVKGRRGGSAPKSGMGSAMSLASGPTAEKRKVEAQIEGTLEAKKTQDHYYVSEIHMGTNEVQWKQVTGKPLKVKGFENDDFFEHQSGYADYTVSDGRTGLAIAHEDTPYKARKKALEILSKVGKQGFDETRRKIMTQTMAIQGTKQQSRLLRSPRYGGKGTVINRPKGMRG